MTNVSDDCLSNIQISLATSEECADDETAIGKECLFHEW